jgi:hypothetical protein
MTSQDLAEVPPIFDAVVIGEQRIVHVLTSRWGYEGVFTDPYLAENYRGRVSRLAAYATHANPKLEITEVPLNPIL